MGTMRWQKELAEAEARTQLSAEFERRNAALDEELADLDIRVQTLQRDIAAKRLAQGSIKSAEQNRLHADKLRYSEMLDLRQAGELDAAVPTELPPPKEPTGESCP